MSALPDGTDGNEFEREGAELPAVPDGPGGGLVVPSREQMELMLAAANDVESLVALERAAAVLQDFARRNNAMKAHRAEFSAYHMRARRKLGVLLSQIMQHGGDRASSHCANLLDEAELKHVGKDASSRYQLLAKVPDEVFEDLLRRNIEMGKETSFRSALRLANQTTAPQKKQKKASPSKKKRSPKASADAAAIPDAVIECVSRTLGDVDVCVGPRVLKCKKQVSPGKLPDDDLRGVVFVTECREPEVWLPKLRAMRAARKLTQVAVLVTLDPCSTWFRDALQGTWQFGALPGAGCLIAHHGRAEAFRVAMHEMGGVAFRA